MPMYCFTSDDGTHVHRAYPVSNRPKTFTKGGEVFHHQVVCHHRKPNWVSSSGVWPQKSCALGVGVDQIHSAEKAAYEAGVPLTFDKATGDAELQSNQHRNQVMEMFEVHDKDACYGQRAPD